MKLKKQLNKIKLQLQIIRLSLAVYYLNLVIDWLLLLEQDRRQVDHVHRILGGITNMEDNTQEQKEEQPEESKPFISTEDVIADGSLDFNFDL